MDKEKRSFEDDGRTVADMSAVGSPYTGLHMNRNRRTETDRLKAGEGETFRPDRAERRALLGGALTAGLVVAGALALGFALLILLIQWIWS